MRFALSVGLLVRVVKDGAGAPLLDRLDDVYANLVDQEAANASLLDPDMDATLLDPSRATVDVRLTVEAADSDDAVAVGLSAIRAAVHAGGISTPYWDDDGAACTVAATEESVEATPLPAA